MIDTQPLVSILLFTYNGEQFLHKQLDSLFSQTYNNIEILVFDDASNDKTINIIKEYQRKHSLKLIQNTSNIGLSNNFFQALKYVKGDFIATCDQDDIWIHTKIEELVKNIKENILIYSHSTPIDAQGKAFPEYKKKNQYNFVEGSSPEAFLLFNCISGHNMMFKKELIQYIEPLPDINIYFDWWVAYIASSYSSIHYYPKSLTLYRRHSSQQTRDNKSKRLSAIKRFIKKDSDKIKENSNKITILKSFLKLQVTQAKTKEIIEELLVLLDQFNHKYYNKNLFDFLNLHKNDLFNSVPEYKIKKTIKEMSKCIWYYRFRCYL